jgi:hypothetical protein
VTASDPARIESLKQTWTDRFVRVKPGHPRYERFAGVVGKVITVNWTGQAIVDFQDGAWYDLPAADEYLEVVPDEEAKAKYDPAKNSSQKHPERQG